MQECSPLGPQYKAYNFVRSWDEFYPIFVQQWDEFWPILANRGDEFWQLMHSPSNETNSGEFVLQLVEVQTCSPAADTPWSILFAPCAISWFFVAFSEESLHVCHMQDFVFPSNEFQF
ncbi:hypothetical protein RJT34_31739 [Clitoria ternatea]|uniref:Uncharacterized protein n=1 Tax=Clitoria ternatea TaxID=43366 RepID=A0AAN9EZ16_CLITE